MASYKCVVPSCTSNLKAGVQMFKFPGDKKRTNEWLQQIGLTINEIKIYSKVCVKHFEKNLITRARGRNALSPKAMPTLKLKNKRTKEQATPSKESGQEKKLPVLSLDRCETPTGVLSEDSVELINRAAQINGQEVLSELMSKFEQLEKELDLLRSRSEKIVRKPEVETPSPTPVEVQTIKQEADIETIEQAEEFEKSTSVEEGLSLEVRKLEENGVDLIWGYSTQVKQPVNIFKYKLMARVKNVKQFTAIGEVAALELPMKCTLYGFETGKSYEMSVEGWDDYLEPEIFSNVVSFTH